MIILNFISYDITQQRNAMNLSKRSRHQYGSGLNDMEFMNHKFLKYVTPLNCEESTVSSWEYTFAQKSYTDTIPVHLGSWVLTTSKLHLLEVKYIDIHPNIYIFNAL